MQGPVTTQYRWLGKNGYIWMLDHAVLVRNARGRSSKVAGTWIDISERKEAEERLRSQLEVEQLLTEVSTHFVNVNSEAVEAQIGSALRRVGEFTRMERAHLILLSKDGKVIEDVYEWTGAEIQTLKESLTGRPVVLFPLIYDKLTQNEPLKISSIQQLPMEATIEREFCATHGIKSFLILPIYLDKKLFAILELSTGAQEKTWFQHEVRALQLAGEVFAGTLARK